MGTVANCQIALKEVDQAVSSAYEALHLFEELKDTYGKSLALKLLKGAGQSQAEIHEQQEQQLARFEGVATKDSSAAIEEKKNRDEAALAVKNTRGIRVGYLYVASLRIKASSKN